jgi:hypothetical protein
MENITEQEANFYLGLSKKIATFNLFKLVKEMRNLQVLYFSTRDKGVLALSKAKEKEVDEAIKQIESPGTQQNLF